MSATLIEPSVAGGMYPRPWRRAITFAPPQKPTIALFTVRVLREGQIESGGWGENWEVYAGIPGARAQAVMGPADWSPVDAAGLKTEDLDVAAEEAAIGDEAILNELQGVRQRTDRPEALLRSRSTAS